MERRLIRVLHDESFRDDATRMLRAVRYEGRLGFRIERHTAELLQRDLSYLATISGARLRRELLAMFDEERPRNLLLRCQELGLLAALHPSLRLDEEGEAAFRRAEDERPAPWDELCLCLLCWGSSEREVESLVERLSLAKRFERALRDTARLAALLPALSEAQVAPSRVVEMLEPLSAAAVWALALRTAKGGQRASGALPARMASDRALPQRAVAAASRRGARPGARRPAATTPLRPPGRPHAQSRGRAGAAR